MNKEQKLLLTIHGSYGLAFTMAGLFLNLYLWRLTNDLSVNASFVLVSFFFGTIAFWVGGKIAKQKDRLIAYQLGVCLTALFYFIVVLLKETVASYPMLLGVINGLGGGFYWLGFLILLYDLVDINSRSSFMGKQSAVLGVVNTIGPVLAGSIIAFFDLFGYTIVFSLSFLLFSIGVILSFKLPKDPSAKRSLKLPLLWRLNRRYVGLKKMWLGWIVWGFCEGLLLFLPPLLLYIAVNNELIVGITAVILGIISITSSLWHSKYNHKERAPYTVLYVWIIYVLATLPLIFFINIWTIFVFLVINEVAKILIGVSYFGYMLEKIGVLPRRSGLRTESMILREIILNTGRLLSIVTFILLYQYSQDLIYYLLFFAVLIQGYLFKIMKNSSYEKEFTNAH